jgi:hypothetical protein
MKPFLLLLLSLASPLMAESRFQQPAITDVKPATACVIDEVHPDSETFYVRIGNYGKTTPIVPQAWDASTFTGLKTPPGLLSRCGEQSGIFPSSASPFSSKTSRNYDIIIHDHDFHAFTQLSRCSVSHDKVDSSVFGKVGLGGRSQGVGGLV